MTYTVFESTSRARLKAYRKSDEFANKFLNRPEVDITCGYSSDVELDSQGNTGTLYWMVVEDALPHGDNVTYRLNEQGIPEFWATGVEV